MSDILDDRSYTPSQGQYQVDPQAKQKKFVKVFGWITFGFSCWFLLSSLWGVISSLMGNMVSDLNNLPGIQSDFLDQMETMMAWTAIISVFAVFLSVLFMIGSLKFVKYQEIGRKMMIYGYIGAIVHTLAGMMILWFGFNTDEILASAQMGNAELGKAAGVFSSMMVVVKVVSSIFYVAMIIFYAWLITQFNLDRIKALFK